MKRKKALQGILAGAFALGLTGMALAGAGDTAAQAPPVSPAGHPAEAAEAPAPAGTSAPQAEPAHAREEIPAPPIVDRPISWSAERDRLAREYALAHYGEEMAEIVPQAVVVHWTAGSTADSAYYHFDHETAPDGTMQVCSQFLVDRDGTILRLTPETKMARHAIGYNWCAIGIENVGGVGNREDLTDAQLSANIRLIRYLRAKYPTIRVCFGHYQQDIARASGLYRELVPGYRSSKSDPGPRFMQGLADALEPEGLEFFHE